MFTIYYSDVTGVPSNCSYSHKKKVIDEESLKEAISHDYVCAEYKNSYRSGDNFIGSDCIPVDSSFSMEIKDFIRLTNHKTAYGNYDHMGSSFKLVDNFNIKNVVFNSNNYKIGDFSFISINKDFYDENDSSMVLYNNYSGLFMGDASIRSEEYILDNYNISNIDFLKVGHHGSDTSSSKDFINKVNPRYSFISVGLNNKFGHPKSSVIDNLSSSNIYRTDFIVKDSKIYFYKYFFFIDL